MGGNGAAGGNSGDSGRCVNKNAKDETAENYGIDGMSLGMCFGLLISVMFGYLWVTKPAYDLCVRKRKAAALKLRCC